MTYDYDGFGAPVLQLTNCYIHENGAWRWRTAGGWSLNGGTTYFREPIQQEDLEHLREALSRALEIVERQIGAAS